MPASDVLSAADVAEFAELIADLSYPDRCEIVRAISPGEDAFGNALPPTEGVVEEARCELRPLALGAQAEQVRADRLTWTAGYEIELEPYTVVSEEDTIRVNGARTFHVGKVVTPGAWAFSTVAYVEERG